MTVPSREEALEHFGVKGMHWGQRKVADIRTNRQRNKASRQKDQAARNAEIDAARNRIASGKNRQDFLDAKARFKTDKKTIGSREARKKFDAVKQKNLDDAEVAARAKSGAETAGRILGTVGGILIKAALSGQGTQKHF